MKYKRHETVAPVAEHTRARHIATRLEPIVRSGTKPGHRFYNPFAALASSTPDHPAPPSADDMQTPAFWRRVWGVA